MGPPFPSRTVAELPTALVRSAEPTTYALITTAVDARSPQVEIAVNVCLKNLHYGPATTRLPEDGQNSPEVINFLTRSTAHQDHRDSLTIVDRLALTHPDKALLAALHSKHSYGTFVDTHMVQDGRSNRQHLSRTIH